ncbi:Protein of uncharacterised function (DUF3159) [Nocardia otitidiscaviarum]|uniref:Protein of uncharacterized function (DUF3159) n=2 Tax=Nocardia otitidiscaviarum TaxID=1823 RepID=A0A378YU32_9NOCA|nr:Protein of uncharacterised function (DUF3159) [Nocardia otitidiscaviarum]
MPIPSSDDKGTNFRTAGQPGSVDDAALAAAERPIFDDADQALLAAADREAAAEEAREERVEQSLLEQMGGFSGLIYSSLPVVVFVPVNTWRGLTTAIWAALGVATAILIWRIVRRDPVQPAISGFLGVGVCAFIAYRMGEAKGFFLFGIYASLVYAGAFVLSLLVRWPLAGVIWGFLNGHGSDWRSDRRAMRLYDLATAVWAVVFSARYVVQNHFYDADSTGLLAAARIAMGWPLTAVALLVTVWAVRRAGHLPARKP